MNEDGKYLISGDSGFILHVTGSGLTVKRAQKNTYSIINKIVIPKMFYRNDIGLAFITEDKKKLKSWEWI